MSNDRPQPRVLSRIDRDFEASPTLWPPSWIAAVWIALLGLTAFAYIATTGGWRPGVEAELATSSRFRGELLAGALLFSLAVSAAARLSIPGLDNAARWRLVLGCSVGLWLALFAWGVHEPHVEPSMLGKRPGCQFEVALFGFLGALLLLPALSRRLSLAPRLTGAVLLGSGALVSNLAMQVGCMIEPWHALTHHAAPVIALAFVGALIGPRVFRI
ncbi:MAG: NrsF family protein [Myxococcota bacterium]